MKQFGFILILILSLVLKESIYAQCIPDTVGCQDINEPGQICPDTMPDAYVGTYYEETVTIWPPSVAMLGELELTIHKIVIDSVGNLPRGIEYVVNAPELYPDTAYCVSVYGTPSIPGTYPLYIRVIPYIIFLETVIESTPQVNDTSLSIVVHPAEGLVQKEDPRDLIEIAPNPFHDRIRIIFHPQETGPVLLKIFSANGDLIYTEHLQNVLLEKTFKFDGRNLETGIYFYSVTTPQATCAGKFIKLL
jgi:hypothetical protein